MATVEELYQSAYSDQRGGRLAQAESQYRQLLELQPEHGDALHLLGVLAYQQNRHREAVELISKALTINDRNAAYHTNLGLAYRSLGSLNEAGDSFERALQIKPDNWAARNNLGVVRLEQGRLEEATRAFEQASKINSSDPEALCNLGKSLNAQKRHDLAIQQLQKAIELKPDYLDAHIHLGLAHRSLKQLDEAAAAFKKAVEIAPNNHEALCHLGSHLVSGGDPRGGEALLLRSIELKPDYAPAYSNLGVALKDQGRLEESVHAFEKARSIQPDFAHAANNMGATLLQLGRWQEAVTSFEDALRVRTDYADARWNRALAWLTMGNLEQGLIEYEWRWHRSNIKPRTIPRPLWDGKPAPGKTILLHGEQGLGDTLQFIRYARRVAERGLKIIVACQGPLVPLISLLPEVATVVAYQPQLPPFHLHAPLMSLPNIFRDTLETIPRDVPYLVAKPELIEKWRAPIRAFAGLRVGIAWQGNPKFAADAQRSFPLRHFQPLAELPGVTLVSVQRGAGVEQLSAAGFPIEVLPDDVDTASGAFMDTAAILCHLDLLVTSDSAIAHLAGALGVKVFLAAPFSADWRWLLGRDDSPWYPTLRLFRQARAGDWAGVFQRITDAVRELSVASRNSPGRAIATADDGAILDEVSPG